MKDRVDKVAMINIMGKCNENKMAAKRVSDGCEKVSNYIITIIIININYYINLFLDLYVSLSKKSWNIHLSYSIELRIEECYYNNTWFWNRKSKLLPIYDKYLINFNNRTYTLLISKW